MSWVRVSEGLGKEDHDFLKLYKIMVTEVPRVLLFLFSTACKKPPTQNLQDYLQGPGMRMSWGQFNRTFDNSQQKVLRRDPTGKEFDATLLGAAIPVSCPGLTQELKDLMNNLRKFRNDMLHNDQIIDLNAKKRELCDLVRKTYSAIGRNYKIDVKNDIKQLEDNVDNIFTAPLPVPDRVKYQQDLKTFQDELKSDFCVRGKEELRTNNFFSTNTDPVSFIPGRKATLKVTAIYTPLDIVSQKLSLGEEDESIEYENLLTILDQNKEIPSIIVLEGPTGAGKTTLIKFLHTQWENCLQGVTCSIKDLDKYQLVFTFDCSNSNLSSYEELIIYHLPKTTQFFRNEDIIRSARQLHILILIDAADDINVKSEKLLRDLLERHVPESKGMLRIVCTTRPQALRDLLVIIQNSKATSIQTKITGIPSNRRGDFVRRLHDEMRKEGQSTQDTEGLVDYLKTACGRLGDHFKFPLMLSLLTYLWSIDPGAVNGVTTISKLYLEIFKLIQEKLFARLRNHKAMKTKDLSMIKKLCNKFLVALYQECLVLIRLDKIILPEESINNLKKAADKYGLPERDVISAFLSHTCEWTASGYEDQYAGSHKSMVELYAAFFIIEVITGNVKTKQQLDLERRILKEALNPSEKISVEEELCESKTISAILKNNDKTNQLVMHKYQNVLVHLLGLLNNRGKDLLHKYHEDVVKLLESCRQGLDWFQVVSEVDSDTIVTKFIAENLTEKERQVWRINESTNMDAAIELMKTVSPSKVLIKLMTDSLTVTGFPILMDKLSKSNCLIELNDEWSFRNPENSSADSYLTTISRCIVKKIQTSVKTITTLPKGVEDLSLGLIEDPITRVVQDPGIEDLRKYFPHLEYLAINVKAGAGTDMLPRLPVLTNRAGLFISEMKGDLHIDWAVNTMHVLQPGQFNRSWKGFGFLSLPNCHLKVDQLCDFVEKLAAKKVTIEKKGYLWVQLIHKNKKDDEDIKKLRHSIKHNLHCSLQWDAVKQYGD